MAGKRERRRISLKWARLCTGFFFITVVLFIMNIQDMSGLFGLQINPWLRSGAFIAFAAAGGVLEDVFIRCNNCNHPLKASNIAFEKRRYRFCPYCGGGLNIE